AVALRRRRRVPLRRNGPGQPFVRVAPGGAARPGDRLGGRGLRMGGAVMAVEPAQVSRVGIVGAGVIGGGWALHFLRMGLHVDVYDPAPQARSDLLRMVEGTWPLLERIGLRAGADR